MSTHRNADEFVFLEAFFPKRVLAFGQWCDGHNLPGRWEPKRDIVSILDFARKVKDAGGIFYFDGKRYEYTPLPNLPFGGMILQKGYISPVERARLLAAGNVTQRAADARSEARTEGGPEAARDFTCLVTRKVSLTAETEDGIRGA